MDNNYPPYVFADDKGELQGILIDQWRLWEEYTGVKVEIVGLPWGEALEKMRGGEFDVIDTIFFTEERAKIFDFTEPYADINVRIFFRKNISGIADAQNLKGFRVAVKSGDANADYLLEEGITSLQYYDSYEEIVQAAANNEESIFVIDEPPALYFLYRNGIQNDFNYSEPLYSGAFHRVVRKGDDAILELVKRGFSSISSQENREIDNRWFGTRQTSELALVMPYLGGGLFLALVVIVSLFIFNTTLQSRVRERTKKLEESEELFRDSIEFLPIPISIADNQGRILEVNRKFTEHYGYTIEDIPTLSRWIESAYPEPEYRKKASAQWDADVAKAEKGQTNIPLREYRITGKDGSLHDVEIIMHPTGNLWVASFAEITKRKQAEHDLLEAYDKTLKGWAKALELRDKETEDHSRRVTEQTVVLAQAMGVDEKELIHIRRGAILHDIGKMGIPDEILRKRGPLTETEKNVIKQHPLHGYELLSPIPYLDKALDIPYCHHERWDGTGYPRGLKGGEIPLAARIFTIIDVWDALLSDRPYSKAWARDETIQYLKDESGKIFDPECVSMFLELAEQGKI